MTDGHATWDKVRGVFKTLLQVSKDTIPVKMIDDKQPEKTEPEKKLKELADEAFHAGNCNVEKILEFYDTKECLSSLSIMEENGWLEKGKYSIDPSRPSRLRWTSVINSDRLSDAIARFNNEDFESLARDYSDSRLGKISKTIENLLTALKPFVSDKIVTIVKENDVIPIPNIELVKLDIPFNVRHLPTDKRWMSGVFRYSDSLHSSYSLVHVTTLIVCLGWDFHRRRS